MTSGHNVPVCNASSTTGKIAKFLFLILCLYFTTPNLSLAQTARNALVLYPYVQEPYTKVFDLIRNGIQSDTRLKVRHYGISAEPGSQQIKQTISEQQPDIIIALGQRSVDALATIAVDKAVIISAVVSPKNNYQCVCMNIDTDIVFSELKKLQPKIKRIHTVYNASAMAWLIPGAKQSAQKLGIQLKPLAAVTAQEAARFYKQLLANNLNSQDAIWLPIDTVIPADAILPDLLSAAWRDNFVIFSNNPYHTRRGGLFSMYPDNSMLGKQIAQTAVDLLDKKSGPRQQTLKYAHKAINSRTAYHLELDLSEKLINEFNLVYPLK